MGCDYYIETELVVEFIDSLGNPGSIYTNREIQKGYIFSYHNTDDSDDDMETQHKKYMAELERRINQHANTKMLFENDVWIKDTYKKRYEEHLLKTFCQIHQIQKVYRRNSAWKRT